MPSTETVTHFLSRLRKRLDEEVDPGSNLWANQELLEYLNEGMRTVWLTLRETGQNYFIRRLRSSDGVITIGDRDYDTTALQVVAGRSALQLPPDCVEVRGLSALSSSLSDHSLVFVHRNQGSPEFREATSFNSDNSSSTYIYDIEFRLDGPWIVFAPGVGADVATVDIELAYIALPPTLTMKDTFENAGFNELQLDAVLVYAVQCALKKPGEGAPHVEAKAEWEAKRQEAQRAAGPRQSFEPELVQGFMEDEL